MKVSVPGLGLLACLFVAGMNIQPPHAEDAPATTPRYAIVVSITNAEDKTGKVKYNGRDFDTKETCEAFLAEQHTKTDETFKDALVQLYVQLEVAHAWPTAIECLPVPAEGPPT